MSFYTKERIKLISLFLITIIVMIVCTVVIVTSIHKEIRDVTTSQQKIIGIMEKY